MKRLAVAHAQSLLKEGVSSLYEEACREVRSNMLRGGLVFKAHRLVYHSTLGSRVIKKKKNLSIPGTQV